MTVSYIPVLTGATHVRNSDSRDNLARLEIPKAKCISLLNTKSRLQNRDRNNKVRSKDNVLVKVHTQSMRRELLSKNVKSTLNILRPLMDDVTIGISLDQTTGRCTDSTAHVSDEETTVGLGADLIDDGAENAAVAVIELGMVWVRSVEVESSVLGLEKREKTTSDKSLAIKGAA